MSLCQYGIIGLPLSHSRSPQYFKAKFEILGLKEYAYSAFPLTSMAQFEELIHAQPQLRGLNVTSPYKQTIIPYLDQLDSIAEQLQAVNVVKIERSNSGVKCVGYNSDAPALCNIFRELINSSDKALIFGSGGAGQAASYALRQFSIPHHIISRNPKNSQLAYSDITQELLSEYQLLINATPLGMDPLDKLKPNIPYDAIHADHLLFDMIYNPEETLFLKEGRKRGAQTVNGEKMFTEQAEISWRIWNNPN